MASAKKKQDEKNLKTLRELVSQLGNKECFDCQQRGPTYVNMTIGSFVCTTCSGILRGLTPPHRVKSISMTTFTQEEIDFLKERGNEFCRAIWLGLMPQNTLRISKDEQKIKDFMSAKYELKRYYIDPVMANQLLNQNSQSHTKVQIKINTKNSNVKIPPVKSISSPVPISNTKSKETELVNSNTVNFIADFSKIPDISLNIPTTFHQPIIPQPSFANFDNNPIFNSSKVNQISSISVVNTNGIINTPPTEDRYAALKDLDSLMKQANLKDDAVFSNTSWNIKDTNNDIVGNSTWCAFDKTSSFISNPFAEDSWQPSINILNNNHNNDHNNFQQLETSVFNTANPFRSTQVPAFNNEFHWFGQDTQNLENVPSSLLSPLPNKSWQPTVTGFKANPFVVGSNIGDTSRNSNNPFL